MFYSNIFYILFYSILCTCRTVIEVSRALYNPTVILNRSPNSQINIWLASSLVELAVAAVFRSLAETGLYWVHY